MIQTLLLAGLCRLEFFRPIDSEGTFFESRQHSASALTMKSYKKDSSKGGQGRANVQSTLPDFPTRARFMGLMRLRSRTC